MRMKIIVSLILTASLAISSLTPALSSDFKELIDELLESERKFDSMSMSKTMCASYSEISPVGDVDDRTQVLSFYKKENQLPVTLRSEVLEDSQLINTPFVIEKLIFDFNVKGVAHRSILIGSFWGIVASGKYKVCRAQYTNYHNAKK